MKWKFVLNDIRTTAESFWKAVGGARVFAFHGDIGAGKTTFIHALCDVRGVKDVISSPTFSIINEYLFSENEIEKKIYHIDLYRLKDEEEASLAGVEDCLYSDNICLVEWPEKSPHLFPDDTLHVFIEAIGNQTRLVRIRQN
jgi:tRNA threonylcarbamoyladenosine biosynthesis protein TsaE